MGPKPNMIYALDGVAPQIADTAFIADNATVIGKVFVGARASLWFGAVLRGDNEAIIIGEDTNVQENATLHTDMGFPLTIGAGCTIGHNAIVHGCTIENNCLIGMGAIVMNGVTLGENSLVAAGALIPEGKIIPAGSLVVGSPGKVVRTLTDDEIGKLSQSAQHYAQNGARFARGLKPLN